MKTTKYPVVLVHGIMVRDVFFWPAFRGITDFLRNQGVTVYVTNQDGLGTFATNAEQLKEEIQQILKKENCDKVNIIAHSKGGLDARYMISQLGGAQFVASLTTLSTPHYGSGIGETLLKLPKFLAKIWAFFLNTGFRILGDRKPNVLQIGHEITAEGMVQFNETVLNDPSVYYQSYASAVPKRKAFLRMIPYEISYYCEKGDTDGVVGVKSSRWGNYRGFINENMDHFRMAGIYGTKRRLVGVGLFYLHIIQELQTMGF